MHTAVPVYRRIIDDIRFQIESGELKPGDKVPSVSELMVAYRCSDTPVKTALRLLQDAGVLQGHQGRGVYVMPAKP
jgi:DNA-binding GntR family transcriptional regulator